MRRVYHAACIICPGITVLFSLLIGFVTMYIENRMPPLFIYLSTQFYLNWYLVCNINKKVVIPFKASCPSQENIEIGSKFWHCGQCKQYTRRPAYHCSFCKKCFYYRDHHCFFLGACVLRQNMGNFILVCLYASFSCIYSMFILGPYLYEYFIHMDSTKFNVYYFALNFFFPITLVKFFFIGSEETADIFLVTLFNVSITIGFFSLAYGSWKLYACLLGKQKYYFNNNKQQDIYEIFGSYGFFNIIFPLNGFLHSRSIDEKYELKSV